MSGWPCQASTAEEVLDEDVLGSHLDAGEVFAVLDEWSSHPDAQSSTGIQRKRI